MAYKLHHEIVISGTSEAVRQALGTAEGIRGWNTPLVQGTGALGTEWILEYPNRPDFAWRIDLDGPEEILWTCTKGPGDAVGTTARFVIDPQVDGRVRLHVTHGGWPHDEANFTKCNTLWGALLDHLREYVQSEQPEPAFY
ncbi:MAG TPA: SRPBCC domain-containing protein [Kaistia sp.]|nr:SRPBCC domain-containing protein [Kaistia sp.]